MPRDRCKGCEFNKEYPAGRTLCLRYGWDYPGYNWICPDGMQLTQETQDLPGRTRIFCLDAALAARFPFMCCEKCGNKLEINQLIVSRRVGSGKYGRKGEGPKTSTVHYHYLCADLLNII